MAKDCLLYTSVQRLAAEYGVATEYRGFEGDTVTVPEQTLRSVLTALGADVTDDDAAARTLRERELAPWRRLLPPVVIAEEEQGARVAVTTAQGDPVRVRVWPEGEPEQVRELHPAPGVEAETREVDGLTRRRTQYELCLLYTSRCV